MNFGLQKRRYSLTKIVFCLLSLSFVFELMRREAAAPCCTDQERVLITFHHKEGRGRITRSRHIHRNQASNHFHFPNQPNRFPSPCLTLAGIKDWASLEIVPPSIHTEIPQLPHYTWAAYQNCRNRSNSLHCSPMYCIIGLWDIFHPIQHLGF